MKIISVVGARPNFMKIAPIMEELKKYPEVESLLVHTGQHYDETMSDSFFKDLGIPRPDINMDVGSKSHAVQTAEIMVGFEKVILSHKPNLVIVVGDVNSTLACSLTCSKLNIPVAHVEAGLRSFDRTMPEEINRILTDAVSDYLFTTEKSAKINLLREGRPKEKIYFVGNVMVDTLLKNREKADRSLILSKLNLIAAKGDTLPYVYLTLHRPSNVDNKKVLLGILKALAEIQQHIKIVWPIHPRTKKKIEEFNFSDVLKAKGIILVEPLGYLDSLKLISESRFTLTDSGGIQEETTILNIPCLTLRNNTERPVTVEQGSNTIVGTDRKKIVKESLNNLKKGSKRKPAPELWDGRAAERLVEILIKK
jgi:UDP-N-acetylglucosamine 2-epimerase (non-hydrolysing)